MATIRPARVEDASGIALVHVESWKTTYRGIVPDSYLASLNSESRAQNWKEQLDAGVSTILIAEDEGHLVGFLCGGESRDKNLGVDAELYAIYILYQSQRQGIGRALVRSFAKQLANKGFRSVMVWVLEKNPSVAFYTGLGGTQVAEKQIEIGGAQMTEIALGWQDLADLLEEKNTKFWRRAGDSNPR